MEALINLQYDWAHNKIITNTVPRLNQLGAVKVALNLWFVETEIEEILTTLMYVQNKIPLLQAPEPVAKNIAMKAELIGEQLSEFFCVLPTEFSMLKYWSSVKNKIHWTEQATIDKSRTAEALTDSDDIALNKRFLIAVDFCLKDRIDKLCLQMSPSYAESELYLEERLDIVGDCPVAMRHFDIRATEFDYNDCLSYMSFNSGNELFYLYHWNHFSEQEKLQCTESFCVNSKSKLFLFVFTHCGRERRLQLLKDEESCGVLLQEFLHARWLPMFDAFAKEVVKSLTLRPILELLFTSAKKIESAVLFKQKYIQICTMFLSSIRERFSMTCPSSDSRTVNVLYTLVIEGEIELVKDFFQSMGIEWRKSFLKSFFGYSLSKCCLILLKCGILELTISSSFSTIEERKIFFTKECFMIAELFVEGNQVNDIDRIVSVLFSDLKDVQSYKKENAEEIGLAVCSKLLCKGDWKTTMDYVHWSFESEEEIICFYHKFFRSDMNCLLDPDRLKKSSETLVSLIKANVSLGRQFNSELIFHVFLSILSKQRFLFFDRKGKLNKIKALFKAFDAILLACFQDDDKKLIEFKERCSR